MGISGIPLSPTSPPLCGPGRKIWKGGVHAVEIMIHYQIQIPRCDTHFVQFKEEKLIQLGHFFFLERNRNFVYHKDFGR